MLFGGLCSAGSRAFELVGLRLFGRVMGSVVAFCGHCLVFGMELREFVKVGWLLVSEQRARWYSWSRK